MLSGSLQHLKDEGHRLLDEYREIARVGHRRSYMDLEAKLNGRTPHFGQMKDKQSILLACGALKKMIASKAYEKNIKVAGQLVRQEEGDAGVRVRDSAL